MCSKKKLSETKEKIELYYDKSFQGEETLDPTSLDNENIYPSKNLKVKKDQYSIFELHRKFKKDPPQIIMDPEFQRLDVWDSVKKSELIESTLMGLPLPLLYFTEDQSGKLIVVDGKQRLTTFFEFIENKFELTKLRILSKLNKPKFRDLTPELQSFLEDYQLHAHVINYSVEDRIKFDIFDRVNRGGTQLNNQEMRNALYIGKATKLLKKLSELPIFIKATGNSIKIDRMKDRYLILRFISFYLWKNNNLKDYNGNIIDYTSNRDDFLGKTMESINRMNDNEILEIENTFIIAMKTCFDILGDNCFRLPSSERKNPINMCLFETLSYLCSDSRIEKKQNLLKIKYIELVENDNFRNSLLYYVDNTLTVKKRFEIIENIKQDILNDR